MLTSPFALADGLPLTDLSDSALVSRIRDGLAAAPAWPESVFSALSRLDHVDALAAAGPDTPEMQALIFSQALAELARRVDSIEPQPRADLLALLWRPPSEFARRARPLLMRTRPELETMRVRHQNWLAAAKTRSRAKEHRIARVTVEVAQADVQAVRDYAKELNKKRGLPEPRRPGRPSKNDPVPGNARVASDPNASS